MSETTYALISARDHTGRRVTKRVRIFCETDKLVYGVVVDHEGADVGRKLPTGEWQTTIWLVATDTITRRIPLTVSLTYGLLVDADGDPA